MSIENNASQFDGPARIRLVKLVICLALGLGTLAVYAPVRQYDFVNYDDDDYVTQNPHVSNGLTGDNVVWAFTRSYAGNWHPLTWLSHMLDVQLYGLNPGGHHLTNVVFHAVNAVLLFLIFVNMTGAIWRSAFVAAIFAWHPLHVESVAWISERKDVLSAFFWILTITAYICYVRRPNLLKYLLVVLCFAFGLMSKPMLVTLPFVLLLLDYWPLQRARLTQKNPDKWLWLLAEKLPLLALVAVSSALTFIAQQRGGAVVPFDELPFQTRLSNALVSYVTYLSKSVCPTNLAIYYPMRDSIPLWEFVVAGLLLLTGTAVALTFAKRHPYLPVGWFLYLGTLIPVIGIVQVGNQAMADRYMYLPLIGLSIVMAWGTSQLCTIALNSTNRTRLTLAVASTLLLAACLAVTANQLTYWRNSITLFTRALSVTSGNWLAQINLGKAFADEGKVDEAARHFRAAVQIRPHDATALSNLGIAITLTGNPRDGVEYARAAVRLRPVNPAAQNNLGFVLLRTGDYEEAIRHCAEALRLKPDWAEANGNLGSAQLAQGRVAQALAHFREALRVKPDSSAALNNLAWVLATYHDDNFRNGEESLALAERAAELSQHREPSLLDTLAAALAENRRFDEAVKMAEQAHTLAISLGDSELAAHVSERLELYKRGIAYRK